MNDSVWMFGLLLLNGMGFIMMGSDKQRAIRHQWRISEHVILTIALGGGSIGVLAGMMLFRHKTNKGLFVVGLPLILGLHCAVLLQFL